MHVGSPQPSHHKTVTATDQERPLSGRTPPPRQRGTALMLPLSHCQTEELDRLITSRCMEPYYSNPLPLPQQHRTSAQQAHYSTAPGPSHYQLNHWLLALWQLFQNTTWDRWQYQNGITISPGNAISPPLEIVPFRLSPTPSPTSSHPSATWCKPGMPDDIKQQSFRPAA